MLKLLLSRGMKPATPQAPRWRLLRHLRLKLGVNCTQKWRSPGATFCEIFTPILLLGLLCYLSTVVPFTEYASETYECETRSLDYGELRVRRRGGADVRGRRTLRCVGADVAARNLASDGTDPAGIGRSLDRLHGSRDPDVC